MPRPKKPNRSLVTKRTKVPAAKDPKLSPAERGVLVLFEESYGATIEEILGETGVKDWRALCPGEFDAGPDMFFDNLRDRMDLSLDDLGYSATLQEVVAFVSKHWNGTLQDPWQPGEPPDE
jgi:hypothetical protein